MIENQSKSKRQQTSPAEPQGTTMLQISDFATAKLPDEPEIVTKNCEFHGDYEAKLLAVLHDGKKKVYSQCQGCKREDAAKRQAQEMAQQALVLRRRLEETMKTACIPPRFAQKSLDSYVATSDSQINALSKALSFAANFERHLELGSVLVFSGSVGVGKSHLAIGIAKEVMLAHTVFYATTMDCIRMIRSTWSRGSAKTEMQVINELQEIDLLILDEVGVQRGTEDEQNTVFDIIDKRYLSEKPTICITNLNANDMREMIGVRSFDRLRENGEWVSVVGDSYRANIKGGAE